MKKQLTRIYHPYWLWEENEYNMWGTEEVLVNKSKVKKFIQDTEGFGYWMMRVVKMWRYSCEHNLSNTEQNRVAWLGQAACSYALNCPEDITREVWWKISEKKRNAADEKAQEAIIYWEEQYAKKASR